MREQSDAARQQSGDGDGAHDAHRTISKKARSRCSVGARHESTSAYARYAVDAAFDMFDGEPMEVFEKVNKLDTTLQRKLDHELRREMFARLLTTSSDGKSLTA